MPNNSQNLPPSVSVRDLSLNFGAVKVLQSLSLDVVDGEFLVLLGPSGCGKSTLLNCIAGLLDVSDGQIFIKNKNVTWEEPKDRGIGMVFQSYALYPQMTVRGNLTFGLKNAGVHKTEIKKRVERTAAVLQIEELLSRKPAALSGGQRQRVAIGRALVRDVDVFLFDEPLSNLDAKLRSELRVEIKRLHHKLANTMVYVTHDQIEALTLADRIAVMKGGVIQQLDDPLTIYNRPKNLFVAGFIGSPSMSFIQGRVEQQDNQMSFVQQDLKINLTDYMAEHSLSAGQEVILGVRPEHITISHKADSVGHDPSGVSVEGVVDIDEPMGADSLIWVRVDSNVVSVRVNSMQRFSPEDLVTLTFNMKMSSVFDIDSQNRL